MNNSNAKNIILETRLWAFAAWTIPFVVLAIIFFISILGWKTLYDKIIIAVGVGFVTVSVLWWWWAISKISQFAKMMMQTDEKLQTIKKDIAGLKEDL